MSAPPSHKAIKLAITSLLDYVKSDAPMRPKKKDPLTGHQQVFIAKRGEGASGD
jgi:hypothetical protein